jgi:hypothetical protein
MKKLLLVTWNVEGNEKLDIEETEPQLAFVAYWMTKNGQQTISEDDLKYCLVEARNQMPEVLGYTNINPAEFIKQVESRSSLLIMSGYKRLDSGQLSAVYEFLHLSFQEYLTAKAIIKKFIPISDIKSKIVDIIIPHVNNENWKEVIPLVAVLLERDCKDLVEYLIQESKRIALKTREEFSSEDGLISSLLASCLENEVQITPDLLGNTIEWNAKCYYVYYSTGDNLDIILKSKFGNIYRDKVRELFFKEYDDRYASSLSGVLGSIFLADNRNLYNHSDILKQILIGLKSENKEEKCITILGLMELIYYSPKTEEKRILFYEYKEVFDLMFDLLKTNDPHYLFSICWCIAWAGDKNVFPDYLRIQYVIIIADIWIKSITYNTRRMASWALCYILVPTITKQNISEIKELSTKVREYYDNPNNDFDKLTAAYFRIILGEKFDEKEFKNISRGKAKKSKNFLLFVNTLKLKKLDGD